MKTIPLRLGALLLTLAVGCSPEEQPAEQTTHPGVSIQDLEEENALTANGLAFNGLAFNGLAFNGLAFNGLASSEFASWFQQDPTQNSLFMKYLVRCAVPEGQTRTYSDGSSTYTWNGSLGLAPDWSAGSPVTPAEQQVVTACLAALVNKFGYSIKISLLGRTAEGRPIPYKFSELTGYRQREACFFGNLFTDEGVYVGNDQALFRPSQSSFRACALSGSNACPPLIHIGNCHTYCKQDPTRTYFTQCTYQGKTYQPITTRLRSQDIYWCGDHTCQPTESCGTGVRYDNCVLDCGRCN